MKGNMDAKRKMLKELKRQMMKEDDVGGLGDKLKSKMKVTVAADDPKGLKKGLSKAEEILAKRKEMLGLEDMDEEPMEDMEEMMEMMEGEEEEYADGGLPLEESAVMGAMPEEIIPKEDREAEMTEESLPEEAVEGEMPEEEELVKDEDMEELSKEEIMEKIAMLQEMLEGME